MRGVLVALDLETTGLDIHADTIIEIGAVKIENGIVLDSFSTLINPGIEVPAQATQITGIHSDDLVKAPTIRQALPDLVRFAGNSTIIGQNIAFDLSFLRRHNVLQDNPSVDTFDLASILLPGNPRYDLNSLAQHFGIPLEQHHRALDDARATALLYWALWNQMLTLPFPIVNEICLGIRPQFEWGTAAVFEAALRELEVYRDTPPAVSPAFAPAENISDAPLFDQASTLHQLPTSAVDAVFLSNGSLQQIIPDYEVRTQQHQMARAVADSFNTHQHLLVEAGTGTGKSLAYLIPAAQWASSNQQHVVISTNTLNLQDQLLRKDIPVVEQIIGQQLRTAVLKGRSNYICPRRLQTLRRRRPGTVDELKMLAKLLIWLQNTQTGEKNELSLRFTEHSIWNHLSADDEDCTAEHCHQQMKGICPYFKAHSRAQHAHLIITNHSLLISDSTHGHQVLPEYRYLIVDEAHQLEDAITSSLGLRLDLAGIQHRLSDLGSIHSGLLAELINLTRHRISEKQFLKLERFVQDIGAALNTMHRQAERFFSLVFDYVQSRPNQTMYRLVIDAGVRNRQTFLPIQRGWTTLGEHFEVIIDSLSQLASALTRLDNTLLPELDNFISTLRAACQRLTESHQHLRNFAQENERNTVYWINVASAVNEISIQSAPIHVGNMMTEHIWNTKDSVILTGATLQTANSFEYIRDRLSAHQAAELTMDSPFNYADSSLVYSVSDIPAPNEPGYQSALERGIVELAAELGGRLLVLFTSYQQLRETATNITPRLALGDIAVIDQNSGGNRDSLVTRFISTEKAVLLGTRSFWEGIDIPGDDLSAVIISRLPFAVPTDPVFAARSATYANPFAEYSVPDAILRFRQGFGRLIRTSTDRGVVAIFDSRIVSKAYGTQFLQSLPEVTLKTGSLNDLPRVTRAWLDK
jgi:DNA polymerase-3 subunit epsilon/ATP-dependent DNA helicase DinG